MTTFGTKLKKITGITGAAAAASVISLTALGAGAAPVMAAPANYITQAKAKTAAMDHAKVKANQIYDLDIDFEKSKRKVYYDVEFKANGYEYDYEINATNATIIKFEKKAIKAKKTTTSKKTTQTKITSAKTNKTQTSYIGTAKAKNIALNHAKLTASKVTRLKAELDREKGVYIYEVEFRYGNYEYEYDINATTGKIIKFDKEYKRR